MFSVWKNAKTVLAYFNEFLLLLFSKKKKIKKIYLYIFCVINIALGQHNDNFVCCPADALTWESRKYLIVQEIIQNDPDIICLQVISLILLFNKLLENCRILISMKLISKKSIISGFLFLCFNSIKGSGSFQIFAINIGYTKL